MAIESALGSTSEVMDALGGNTAVMGITGCSRTTVSNWRGSTFPANTFVALTSALAERGYSAPPSLWKMKDRADRRSSRACKPDAAAIAGGRR